MEKNKKEKKNHKCISFLFKCLALSQSTKQLHIIVKQLLILFRLPIMRCHDSFVGLNLQEESAALYTMAIQNNRRSRRQLVTEQS